MTDDYQNLNVRMPRSLMLKLRELKHKAREVDSSTTVADVVSKAISAYYDAQCGESVKKSFASKSKGL